MLSAKRLVNMPTRARRYTTHKRACRHVCKPYAIQPVVKERLFSTVRKEAVLHYTCPQGIHVSHAKFLPRYRNCYEKEVWLYRDDGDSFIADSGVLCCQCCLASDPYWHDSGGKPVALLESAFLRAIRRIYVAMCSGRNQAAWGLCDRSSGYCIFGKHRIVVS